MTAPGMLWGSRGIYLETTSTLANNLQLALVLNISKSPLRRRLIALFQDKVLGQQLTQHHPKSRKQSHELEPALKIHLHYSTQETTLQNIQPGPRGDKEPPCLVLSPSLGWAVGGTHGAGYSSCRECCCRLSRPIQPRLLPPDQKEN